MPSSRQLAAIMFTDIVGYTALMQQNEKKAVQTREKHRRIFNSITKKYKGRILQYYGDGTLSIFNSAIEAVKCGIEMQLRFQKKPAIPVRIGIHTGDIIFSEEEIIGDSVNVASRIESLAAPGSVFISDKVYDEIKNQTSIETSLLKTFKLKNVEKPIRVYAVSNAGLTVPKPDDINGKFDKDLNFVTEKKQQPESRITKESALPTILSTKLYIPPPRSKIVHRSRLIEQLKQGLNGKLTLISAPAGFGKTTLISELIANSERRATWLSLDEGDNDPTRFLTYIVASIQTIDTNIGTGVMDLLHSPQPPPTESILTALLNDISTLPDKYILVLDDYHTIDAKPVDNALTFLIEHLPPQMHIVITSRKDPDLPIPKLRVRGELTELRATHLRFTPSEASGFFNQVMGLNLSSDDIHTLESRTEGWIAGLQLAALSMQRREDKSDFIKAFAGHDRYIVDYLIEEVLRIQPESVRNFLLQTSILDRLSGSLCDAVTGQEDGRKLLESFERDNLFVIPLDDKRHWFRYHRLFADVLHTYLKDEEPDRIATLHGRASIWYEKSGFPADAIHHALLAEDFERAADLIELAWPAMEQSFQDTTWLSWVKGLPDELVRTRPVLNVAYAWAFLSIGELEAAMTRLRDVEQLLDIRADTAEQVQVRPGGIVVIDENQYRNLPASIAGAHAYIAQTLGDVQGTIKYARMALDLMPEEDILRRGTAASLLGLACWTNGNLDEAYRYISDAMADFQIAGNMLFAISCTIALTDILLAQGRLQETINTYTRALQLARKQGEKTIRVTADLYAGLGMVYLEQGNLEEAREHLLSSEELGEQAGLPDWKYRICRARIRVKETEGALDSALDLIEDAERLYYRSPLPNLRPLSALRTRIWIKQGRLADAQNWAREQGLSVDDDLSFLREFEYLTLARVFIAEYERDRVNHSVQKAITLLERLLNAAEEGRRMGSVIEILLLQVLAYQVQGNIPLALKTLERALVLAQPEGYVQIFVDEGPPVVELLEGILKTKATVPHAYVKKLLAAIRLNKLDIVKNDEVERLSERETEVLRLISAGLSNKNIMEELFLSLSTVKTHIRNIYSKLNVHSRTQAINKAKELNLL